MLSTAYQPPRPRQRRYIEVVEYCHSVFADTGQTPSYSMIRDALHIGDSGSVRRYVKEAEAAGLISLAPTRGGRGLRRGERIRLAQR